MTFPHKLADKIGSFLPYYINHAIIAALIGLATGEPLCGALFYAGREVRDWQKAGRFDHRGFWWPVLVMGAWKALNLI
jgi:hypothetical protein